MICDGKKKSSYQQMIRIERRDVKKQGNYMNGNIKSEKIMRNNAFDILRYFAAFSVMLLHYTYYAITMSEQEIGFLRVIRRIAEFFPGVVILFSLSGFLISASFERCKTKKEFIKKRVFRLYPELWLCTLVNIIVVIFLAKERLDKTFVMWVITQIFGIANTPSCLKSFASGSVNGALWTIFTEMQLYVVLGITYKWMKRLKQRGWCFLLLIGAGINLICNYLSQNIGGAAAKMIERLFLPYAIWFLIGVFCYQKRERILPILKKYVWGILLLFILNQKLALCSYGYYEDIVTGITLSFATIGLAYTLPAIRIKRDISYGIFLYHWILINIMIYLDAFNRMPWYVCAVLFISITLLISFLSKEYINRIMAKCSKGK